MKTYYSLSWLFSAFSFAVFALLALVLLSVAAMDIIGRWKIFTKAGEPGWKALIPFYSEYTLFHLAWADKYFWVWTGLVAAVQLARGSGRLFGILGGLLALVFGIALTAVTWVSRLRLASSFGKDRSFAMGLFVAGPVFMAMLGFSHALYQGPVPSPIEETIPFVKPYVEKLETKLRQLKL